MPFDPDHHHRRSIRMPDYDYAEDGVYFIILCTYRHARLFGEVIGDEVILNTLGCIAEACWMGIADHFPNLELDAYVIMPNHMHGIVIINRGYKNVSGGVGARHAVPLHETESFGKPVSGSIPTIIRSYKSATTRQINRTRHTPDAPVWQRRMETYWSKGSPGGTRWGRVLPPR